jgi:IPT/TIG domain
VSWTSTPEENAPAKPPPGEPWTDNPDLVRKQGHGNWLARLEKVGAFHGGGALSASSAIARINVAARFAGAGALAPTTSQIERLAAAFRGIGLPTGQAFERRDVTPFFTGSGGLDLLTNDGLSAIVQQGYGAFFSGEGGLVCDTAGGHKLEDGLTADAWPLLRQGAGGVGTLAVTMFASYARAAALAGAGALSATMIPVGPDILSVSPNTGAYDTTVTITGTGFVGVTSVTIGGTAVRSLSVVSSTSITCKPPGLANGAYNVVVTAGAQSDTLVNGFTYSFSPVTDTDIARSNFAIPTGAQGAYVTLYGGGASGGGGAVNNTAVNRYGGGAGGAGAQINRSFISRDLMGSVYTIVRGTAGASPAIGANNGIAGGNSQFTSGTINWIAGGGKGGCAGGTAVPTGPPTFSAGGTRTLTGATPSGFTADGGDGSYWGAGGGGHGGGGGAGGWINATPTAQFGDNGFSSTGGGAGGTAGTSHGPSGSASPNSDTGGGGGGAGGYGQVATTSCFGGGGGGYPAGGGGGSGACRATPNNPGGAGAQGHTKVEWV